MADEDNELAALRAENDCLRARVREMEGHGPRARSVGTRSTPAGRDVLFSAVEKTRMPMILTDPRQPDDPIIFANRAFQELTGYDASELLGRNCRFLQGPRTDAAQVDAVRQSIAQDRDVAIEIVNYRRDGTRFVNDLYISPVFDEDGELLYRFGSQVDNTRAWQTREALRSSESRYRALFDALDEGFCIIEFLDGPHGPDSDYVHIEANPAYITHTGFASIVGRRLRDMVGSEAEAWLERYGHVLRTGEPIHFEQELVVTGRHLEVSAFRIEPPELRQVAVLFRDVTARQITDRQLRQLNETLERRVSEALAERKVLADIVEGTDAFVQVVGLDMRWLAINRAAAREFERIFGVWPRVGDHMLELLAEQPEHRQAVEAVWSRALAGEEFVEIGRFGDVARDCRDYEMRFGTLRDTRGERIGAYQFVYDVSERLQDQARLARTEDALRQAQKMEAVGQLTGGVAHDFNNLLTIIRTSVDLLRRPGLADDRKSRYLDAVSDTVDRASKLTGQLLAFARRQTLKAEVFDVVERVRSITDMLDAVTGARVQVVTALPDQPCFVRTDVSQFETAIVNMAVNARDAMAGEGRLTVTVRRGRDLPAIRHPEGVTGPFTTVELADTGAGIAPEAIGHIFEPFFTTKEVGKGTGLGLSQVFGFAKQSGGDVDVSSELGRGTAFTLYIPQVQPEANGVADSTPDASPPITATNLCVLVVEDNVQLGQVATQILEELGNRTVLVSSAEAALAELEKDGSRFDLVFSDVVMPGMGGVALARELARAAPDLPVLLTSGYSEALAHDGVGTFDLLRKPYSTSDLQCMLQKVRHRGDDADAA